MNTKTMKEYVEHIAVLAIGVAIGVLPVIGIMYLSKYEETLPNISVICNNEVKLSGKGQLYQNGTVYKLNGKSYNMQNGELCWIEEK